MTKSILEMMLTEASPVSWRKQIVARCTGAAASCIEAAALTHRNQRHTIKHMLRAAGNSVGFFPLEARSSLYRAARSLQPQRFCC